MDVLLLLVSSIPLVLLKKSNTPGHDLLLGDALNDLLAENVVHLLAVLSTHLLQDCQQESLADGPVFLLF